MKSEIRILGAPILAGEVVARLGVQTLYPELLARPSEKVPPADAAQRRFSSNLKAETGEDGHVIAVTFQHPEARSRRGPGRARRRLHGEPPPAVAELRAVRCGPRSRWLCARLAEAEAALAAYRSEERHHLVRLRSAPAARAEAARAPAERRRAGAGRSGRPSGPPAAEPEAETPDDARPACRAPGDNEALDSGRGDAAAAPARGAQAPVRVQRGSRERERDPHADRPGRAVPERSQAKRPKRAGAAGRNPVYDALAAQLSTAEADLAAAEGQRRCSSGNSPPPARRLVCSTATAARSRGCPASSTSPRRATSLARQQARRDQGARRGGDARRCQRAGRAVSPARRRCRAIPPAGARPGFLAPWSRPSWPGS